MMLKSMQTRAVVLIGTLSLAAGWLVGNSSVSHEPQAPGSGRSSERRGPRPLGSGSKEPIAPYTEQLRLKMQDVPRSPTRGRNPFSFGARRLPMATSRATRNIEAAAIDAPPAPAPVVTARPRFELSGIASSERDGKSTWTAILMDNGSLVFAAAGEKLAGGYVVVRVGEASIAIADPLGAEQTITLGPARRP